MTMCEGKLVKNVELEYLAKEADKLDFQNAKLEQ